VTQGTLFKDEHPPLCIACHLLDGTSLRLALDGIQDYWAAENSAWLHLKMSASKEPILVVSTVAQMDAAIVAAIKLRPTTQIRPELRRTIAKRLDSPLPEMQP